MIKDIIISIIQFLILDFCQIFLLNNIYFLGFINPMIYIWFIILLPFVTPKWLVLLSSFLLGVSIDIFSADTGINAFVCVFVGFLRPALLNAFSGNIDNTSYLRPSLSSLGFKNFFFFTASTVFIHHLLYFAIDIFSFAEIMQVLARTLLSSVVTIILILLLDMIFFKRSE